MKFYVVGISSRGEGPHGYKTYGDALVYAPDKYKALTMVRQIGWVPNPGGIWLLGTETQRELTDIVPEEVEDSKKEAEQRGVSILWTGP
jgi:hypothetical protein